MRRRALAPLLTVLVVIELMSSGAAVSAQEEDRPIPDNLEVDPVLQPLVHTMWQRSATFRRQCRRLEAERHVRVRVLSDDRHGRGPFFDARSFLHHEGGRLASAWIHVSRSSEAVEHIAHELEHVMEQLDSVDLQAHTVSGAAWKRGDGSFETRRAIVIGQRVAHEVASGTEPGQAAPTPGKGVELVTVQQRDRSRSSGSRPSARVSADGRYVVFTSLVQLVAMDRNQHADIYVLDLVTGQLTLDSVGPGAIPANGWSDRPDISGDGRYLVFESVAGNLTDTPMPRGQTHVFLRDREQGVTRLLSSSVNGGPASGASRNPAIAADGSAVVFESFATDLLDGDSGPRASGGIYLVRLTSRERVRVDVPVSGGTHTAQSMSPAISANGRFVAFASKADLVCENHSGCRADRAELRGASIYVRDMLTTATLRITRSHTGGEPDGPSYHPSISADGRYVAFASEASNLTRSAGSRAAQIYVHDRSTGLPELVSRRPDGRPADGPSRFPAISGDGSVVAFQSVASNLICVKRCAEGERDINLVSDVFLFDRSSKTMTRASQDQNGEWMAPSRGPALDHSGRVLVFSSRHPIDDEDVGHDDDLYVWIRGEE